MTRYLIVDDSRTARMTLSASIRNAMPASDIIEAEDATSAMDVFTRMKPEVVFLDMMLDDAAGAGGLGSTGLVALSLMRDLRPDVRVVLVTSLARDDPDVLDALDLGARGHLEKPYGLAAVKAVLLELRAAR